MADIKQAAIWMREGKRVRRPHHGTHGPSGNVWPASVEAAQGYPEEGLITVCSCHGRPKPFSIDSLLADDWEVAEIEMTP